MQKSLAEVEYKIVFFFCIMNKIAVGDPSPSIKIILEKSNLHRRGCSLGGNTRELML